MTTKNTHHRLYQKKAFWQHHINCWAQTNLTQVQYCVHNNLDQTVFSRWKGKLKSQAKKTEKKDKPLQTERTHTCSFCGMSERMRGTGQERVVRKLFYGENDGIAICDDCLWWKSHKLQVEDKMYGRAQRKECLLCFQDKGGQLAINSRYRICEDCLRQEIFGILLFHPERLPCRHHCTGCYKKIDQLGKILVIGDHHFVCESCLGDILTRAIGKNATKDELKMCYFCKNVIQDDAYNYVGTLPVCLKCCDQMTSNMKTREEAEKQLSP